MKNIKKQEAGSLSPGSHGWTSCRRSSSPSAMQRLVDTSVAIVRGEEKHRRNPYQSHRDKAEPRERNDRCEYVTGKCSKAEAITDV